MKTQELRNSGKRSVYCCGSYMSIELITNNKASDKDEYLNRACTTSIVSSYRTVQGKAEALF